MTVALLIMSLIAGGLFMFYALRGMALETLPPVRALMFVLAGGLLCLTPAIWVISHPKEQVPVIAATTQVTPETQVLCCTPCPAEQVSGKEKTR